MGINQNDKISQLNISHPLNRMFQNARHIYSSIKFSYASTHEIGKIITSLKTKTKKIHDYVKILIWSTPFFISSFNLHL
jgi:hypothetical protein